MPKRGRKKGSLLRVELPDLIVPTATESQELPRAASGEVLSPENVQVEAPSSSSQLADRRAVKVKDSSKRHCGSRQHDDNLDELLTTEAGKKKLFAELRDDYFAAGSAISQGSQGNTWADYHRRWFGSTDGD